MNCKVICVCLATIYFSSVCFGCQTDDDCLYHDMIFLNKTRRVYLECCRTYAIQRKCVDVGSGRCNPPPTWQPARQRNFTWPEIPTWYIPTWPTRPTDIFDRLPHLTFPDMQHPQAPTISYGRGSSTFKYIAIAAVSFFIFVTTLIGLRVCLRRRQNTGQVLRAPILLTSQRPIHEIPVPSQIETHYLYHNDVTINMETCDVSPPSYEVACCDVTHENAECCIPDQAPPSYEDAV